MRRFVGFVFWVVLSGCMASRSPFILSSPDIPDGGRIGNAQVFSGFGCTGENRSPSLIWKNPPSETKSFALLVYDPDAPTGSGWWHWIVYNIPADIFSLPEDAGTVDGGRMPEGAMQGNTDFNVKGYGGPCPPPGNLPHRYIFTLHALKVDKLDLPPHSTAAWIGFMVHQNTLAKTSFTGYYSR